MNNENTLFRASIRVVKSLIKKDYFFDTTEVLKEPIIEAKDKEGVKRFLLEKYPQFFQNGKVYQKETKDDAQFFYVVINKLSNWELNHVKNGSWTCASCGEIHENKYVSRPRYTNKPPFIDLLFCNNGDHCFEEYKKEYYKDVELPDDEYHVKSDSLNYIYKCTEKSTGKSYIGKTRNAPFFRWWNHLKHSPSPFGLHLRTTDLSDWTFEVLEELPSSTPDKKVFEIESNYIIEFDSIENGYNSVISNKKSTRVEPTQKSLNL